MPSPVKENDTTTASSSRQPNPPLHRLDDPAYHDQARKMFEDSIHQGFIGIATSWGDVLMEIYRFNDEPAKAFALAREINALKENRWKGKGTAAHT